MRERDIHWMDAVRREDIDSSGKRRGHRGYEHREAPVLQFLNNERGNEGLLDLGQRRLPHIFLIPPCHSLSQTPKERVAWYSFKKRLLDALPHHLPSGCTGAGTDEETDNQNQEKRQHVFSGKPFREQHGQRFHKTHHRLHRLEQQQNRQVDRNDNKQASNERLHNKFNELFHMQFFLVWVDRTSSIHSASDATKAHRVH